MKIRVFAIGIALTIAACGPGPGRQAEDCCSMTGQSLPIQDQQIVAPAHEPITMTIHALDPANLRNADELIAADVDPPALADPAFADDETGNRYTFTLPNEVLNQQDLVVVGAQELVFAGAVMVPGVAAQDSFLVARPVSSASTYEVEAYIRGLRVATAGEPLDDNLWSFWARLGLGLRFAAAVKTVNPDGAALDELGVTAVRDQQILLSELAPLWNSSLDPLELKLRELTLGYDALEDQRLTQGLPQGGLDAAYRQDVVRIIRAETEALATSTDAVTEAMLTGFLIRSIVRMGVLPDVIFPNDPAASFELRRQESLVALENHTRVLERFDSVFPCPACPPASDPVASLRGALEGAAAPPAGPEIGVHWGQYRGDVMFGVAQVLDAVTPGNGALWLNALNQVDQATGPPATFAGTVKALQANPALTGADVSPAIQQLRTDIDIALMADFPEPTERAVLVQVAFMFYSHAAVFSEVYLPG